MNYSITFYQKHKKIGHNFKINKFIVLHMLIFANDFQKLATKKLAFSH